MDRYGPEMDVKVLYTLESSPQHTMVARLGRAVPVDVTIASISPLSPIQSNGGYYTTPPRQVRFGRIALKTCLGAVCMASPELMPDDKRDYIIYAVDPEESFRAAQQSSPPRHARRSSPLSSSDAGPSKLTSSPPRSKDAYSTPIFVGKGFFNWALEEQGEGETTVTGRVRSDGRRLRYENGNEVEENVSVLEVVIKLKESQARSKNKHFDLVRGLSTSTDSRPNSAISTTAPRPRASRPSNRFDQTLHSEPDYPGSRYDHDPPIRKAQERRNFHQRSDPAEPTTLSAGQPALLQKASATASETAVNAIAAASASAASNPQALQLLSILHSLQQRTTQSTPEPVQQAQLETLLQQVAQALEGGQSPSSGTADVSTATTTPGGSHRARATNEANYASSNACSPAVTSSEDSGRVCYNCGCDQTSTWRHLILPAGSVVNFPIAESPQSSSQAAKGSTPRYAGRQGPIQLDVDSRWLSCNACGMYFLKWENSRPEYVWQKTSSKTHKKRQPDNEGSKQSDSAADQDQVKRPRLSDIDSGSSVSSARKDSLLGSETLGNKSLQVPDASTPSSRQGGLPRTLSEACQRDAKKLETQRTGTGTQKKGAQSAEIRRKDYAREYVLDENTGKYRSRRSMRENPSGAGPGRPRKSAGERARKTGKRAVKGESTEPTTATNGSTLARDNPNRSSPSERDEKTTTNQQSQHHFQAPLPPRLKPAHQSTRAADFAQSSPVRPSMNAGLMHPDMTSYRHGGGHLPFQSPSRDVRFRVPSYLLNSSPGTMMDTLMSETDFDFGSLPSMDMLQTPGTLLGGITGAPLRRSPRKNPHGTVSGQNPYASPGHISPTFDRRASSHDRSGPVLSSNDSPVTRSRTKSGQDKLHPALFSSSDGLTNQEAKSSSTVTSPASPSTKGKNGGATGKKMPQNKCKTQMTSATQAKVTTAARKASISSTNRLMRATSAQTADADEDDSEDNEARLVKGPYQSTGGGSSSREGSVGLPTCPRSPSLARSVRKFARNTSTGASPTSWSMQNGRAKLALLDLPPSSPCFDHPTADSAALQVDDWGRTPSMREFFPTPSDASPANEATESQSKTKAAPSPKKTESKELVVQDRLQVPVVRRRPLPATVEDASSSVSGSSPAFSEDSPDATDGGLFDLLEDPYGLLAASGFGIDAAGGVASLEVNTDNGTSPKSQMTPTSSGKQQSTVSADTFTEVQLHQAKEFGLHLNQFNQSGCVGVAAHVGGPGVASTPKASSIAASPETAPSSPKVMLTPVLDASFLASLPAELSSIFASPKKPLPPHIFDMLTSPRKPKSTSGSSPKEALSPSASGAMVPYGEFDSSTAEADFSALFSNPDIQAMLAEFGSCA